MRRYLILFAVWTMGAILCGCSQSAPQAALPAEPLYVPSTLIVNRPESQPTMLAYQMLPAANFYDFFVPRDEKFVWGSTSLSEASFYSVMVYDAQRISSRRDSGFRYTWEVHQGVNYP